MRDEQHHVSIRSELHLVRLRRVASLGLASRPSPPRSASCGESAVPLAFALSTSSDDSFTAAESDRGRRGPARPGGPRRGAAYTVRRPGRTVTVARHPGGGGAGSGSHCGSEPGAAPFQLS
eukprot:768524-Hanusia_phi.AAC.1